MKPEKQFEQEFQRLCPLWKMLYIKIPDALPIDKDGKVIESGQIHISSKLPCDGILATKTSNYFIEFKFSYNKLLPHQEKFMQEINSINLSYFLLRKKELKKGTIYTIEHNYLYSAMFVLSCIFHTDKLEQLFEFFKDPREYQSQKLMMDNSIPTKRKLNRVRY